MTLSHRGCRHSCGGAQAPLMRALGLLHEMSGNSFTNTSVSAARIAAPDRVTYFRSPEFRNWVRAMNNEGRQVFWLKDVDKTQAAGDIFTFFFKWRADNFGFNPDQLRIIDRFVNSKQTFGARMTGHVSRGARNVLNGLGLSTGPHYTPHDLLAQWENAEHGGPGINIADFWLGAYWASQLGLTREEKLAQVAAFAPHYAKRVYPDTPEDNAALHEAGAIPVIVSNGDQELAIAVGHVLGIKPENVVGSNLLYGADGRACGVNHSYEMFDHWTNRPQPGKTLSFHYWLNMNKSRWGWSAIDEDAVIIGGRDGDSASSDGGMMMLGGQRAAIGNFMVDTPGEPQRLEKFVAMVERYGWTPNSYYTLGQRPSILGATP